MTEFRERFEAYGGDYAETMRRFLGNEAMYLRLLGMLPGDASLQDLGDRLGCGDLDGAFDAAHTLKGVAGNLGLTPLYQAVCAIVEPLRSREDREDYPRLFQTVQLEFLRAAALLEQPQGGERR